MEYPFNYIIFVLLNQIKRTSMNNYKDIEEIRDFIQGMTHSAKVSTEEMLGTNDSVPNVKMYLLKKVNEEGETEYGVGGGPVPNDLIGRMVYDQVVPQIIQREGNEILCSVETTFDKGVLNVEFHNFVTDEKHQEVFDFNKPYQVSDLMKNLCLN